MEALVVFAENVRRLRLERDLTQEALAHRAGLNTTDVRRIETHRRDPGVKVVAKLAAGLGVTIGTLFEGADP
jgi:transcriptional regulator with XRE-family HTH domain